MRFMLLMFPGVPREEKDWMPSPDAVAAMMKYNEELTKAGALLALDGLHPPHAGARVRFAGGKATVTDGPFAETKEVVGGYWIIQAGSKEEAVALASRCPAGEHDMIEVREIFAMSDFPPEVQEVAELSQTPPEQTSEH